MNRPKITIAMPIYNGSDYLEQALRSVKTQTYEGIFIIVSDNASTDNTPDILDNFKQSYRRVSIYRQPTTLSPLQNFRWAVEHAPSDIIMLAAHDDGWSANYVETLLKAIQDASADLAVGSCELMSSDWVPMGISVPPPLNLPDEGSARTRRLLFSSRGSWFYGLWRKEALLRALDACADYGETWGGDFVSFLPAFFSGKVAGAEGAIFYQRRTGLSLETYSPKSSIAWIKLNYKFLTAYYRELRRSRLSLKQKIAVSPYGFGYAYVNIGDPLRNKINLFKKTFLVRKARKLIRQVCG